MPGLPAICDTCLTVWDPHAINIANATNVHIEDVTVSPCPNCGGVGHIPDGIYSATTDTINVVATTVRSARSLALLGRLLQQARKEKVDAAQLARLLEQEKVRALMKSEQTRSRNLSRSGRTGRDYSRGPGAAQPGEHHLLLQQRRAA